MDPYHITLILVALISGVVSPVVLQITKFMLANLTSKKIHYKDTAENELIISKKLNNILEKYKADRVWIAEFHNGESNYSGKSFQKFSETYEEVRRGVSSEALNTQTIPTSIFVKFFNELNTTGFYFCKSVKEISKNKNNPDVVGLTLESFLESRSITSFFSTAIKNIKGDFVGILSLDSTHEPLMLQSKEIQDLTYTAANLAGYLESTISKK